MVLLRAANTRWPAALPVVVVPMTVSTATATGICITTGTGIGITGGLTKDHRKGPPGLKSVAARRFPPPWSIEDIVAAPADTNSALSNHSHRLLTIASVRILPVCAQPP